MNHWERIHLNKGNVMALPVQTEVTQCLKKMLVAGKSHNSISTLQNTEHNATVLHPVSYQEHVG